MRPGGSVGIVGGGLGGLSTAIHLRLAGYPVTIFESNERVGGRANLIERDGFRFDTGPSLLNYPWVFEELFRAAGRELHDYVELIPVEPSVQFRWPDGEIFQLSGKLPHLLAECERLEPGSGPGLMAFFRDAGRKYSLSFEKLVTRNETNPLRWLIRRSGGRSMASWGGFSEVLGFGKLSDLTRCIWVDLPTICRGCFRYWLTENWRSDCGFPGVEFMPW